MLHIIVKVMVSQEFIPGSQSAYDQTKEDQIRISKLVAPYETNQETMTNVSIRSSNSQLLWKNCCQEKWINSRKIPKWNSFSVKVKCYQK